MCKQGNKKQPSLNNVIRKHHLLTPSFQRANGDHFRNISHTLRTKASKKELDASHLLRMENPE